MHMGDARKFRDVAANGKAALVVDDMVSFVPRTVRMVEIRGSAEALRGVEHEPGLSLRVIIGP